jgi:hypothetical protein
MSILCSLVYIEWAVFPIDTVDSEMENLCFYVHTGTSLIVQKNKFFFIFLFRMLACPHIIDALSQIFSSAHSASPLYLRIRACGDYFLLSSCSFICFFYFLFSILDSRPRLTRERALDPGMSCFYFMISPFFIFAFCVRNLLIITNLKWSNLSRSCSKISVKRLPLFMMSKA